jgi:FtsP/CotA-like multicopper oxidase with cupredoxin domain
MATMVAADTRTRHLFHCHLLRHMEYRVICLCAVFRATS